MNKASKSRFAPAGKSAKALLFWLVAAGLTGLVCGFVGGAFHYAVDGVTHLRQNHHWLVFLMPVAGLVIVWSYRTAGLANDSGTNQIIAASLQKVQVGLAPAEAPAETEPTTASSEEAA